MSFSTSSNRSGRSTFGLSTTTILLLVLTIVILSSLPSAHAFGAGNIPSYAYMEGKAFRHGDSEFGSSRSGVVSHEREHKDRVEKEGVERLTPLSFSSWIEISESGLLHTVAPSLRFQSRSHQRSDEESRMKWQVEWRKPKRRKPVLSALQSLIRSSYFVGAIVM